MKIGLKPDEFWNMSMREIDLAIQAYQWRYDRKAELLAHFTASIINVWSKRRVRGRDLYRSAHDKTSKIIDIEQKRREFEEAVRAMGPEAIPVRRGGGKISGGSRQSSS
jgi:hypothetical protein